MIFTDVFHHFWRRERPYSYCRLSRARFTLASARRRRAALLLLTSCALNVSVLPGFLRRLPEDTFFAALGKFEAMSNEDVCMSDAISSP